MSAEKQPSRRKIELAAARAAGFHSDVKAFTRLIIESRVRRGLMNEMWWSGVQARKIELGCTCAKCKGGAS